MSGLIQPTVKSTGGRFDKLHAIQAAVRRANGSYVKVGWQNSERYPDGPTVAQVAIWNEYGTQGSKNHAPVPARPFMRPTIKRSKKEMQAVRADALTKVAFKGWPVDQGLKMIGFNFQERLRNAVKSNTPPPLADRTVEKRKAEGKGTNTLIDTGRMLDGITFVVNLSQNTRDADAGTHSVGGDGAAAASSSTVRRAGDQARKAQRQVAKAKAQVAKAKNRFKAKAEKARTKSARKAQRPKGKR